MERNLTMRILLIDDEPIALTKLELMLTNVGVCDTAASGIAATECFIKAIGDNRPYDLITIDIELPDITGLDLLNRFCLLEKKTAFHRPGKSWSPHTATWIMWSRPGTSAMRLWLSRFARQRSWKK
jgi:PleD family two-component response regulator